MKLTIHIVIALLCQLGFTWTSECCATILVIGDSISLGWMPEAQTMLPDLEFEHADYSHINNQGTRDILVVPPGQTQRKLDFYLEQQPSWELIVINAGIHDMRPFSHVFSTPEQYEANLETIFDTLVAQPAPVLWVTTTPIPDDHPDIDHTIQPTYRAIELDVTQRAGYQLDLYSLIVDDYEDLRVGPANLHFSNHGSQVLDSHITEKIVEILVSPDHDPGNGINGQDFMAWQRDSGTVSGLLSWELEFGNTDANLNDDGLIDGRDFLYWQRRNRSQLALENWLAEYRNPSALLQSIPEPSAGVLGFGALLVGLCRCRWAA
ncbi:MAG: SGNH/GDSL hydrolase family protein [Planctomycetota bacterium]